MGCLWFLGCLLAAAVAVWLVMLYVGMTESLFWVGGTLLLGLALYLLAEVENLRGKLKEEQTRREQETKQLLERLERLETEIREPDTLSDPGE